MIRFLEKKKAEIYVRNFDRFKCQDDFIVRNKKNITDNKLLENKVNYNKKPLKKEAIHTYPTRFKIDKDLLIIILTLIAIFKR